MKNMSNMTTFVRRILPLFPLFIALLLTSIGDCGESRAADVESLSPLPYAERSIPAEQASEYALISPYNNILEGAIFDADGNLLFCDVSSKKVMKLAPDKKLDTVLELPDMAAGGLGLHKDGRLFMAALDLTARKGAILAWSPDTKKLETIIPAEAGYWPNDLVFDNNGGFYFSDFRGSASMPEGGIYYVSPDFKTITPVIANLAQANGVALSPDGKTLWATEFAKNRLHRAELENATTVSVIGSSIPWYFTGPAPDSMRVDSAGNVYTAIYGQGRVLIFNKQGIPVGQILLPERDRGLNLLSTSLAINPDVNDLFVVSSNGDKNQPAKIFRASALAHGQRPLNSEK